MMDLVLKYRDINNQFIQIQYKTLMQFIDNYEKDKTEIKPASIIEATFFENKLNKGKFETLEELYNHCVEITK